MCLILFAHRAHPDYPLLLAANRDEFHQRPTAPARFWEEHPDVLAGRDLQAGGTWMGVSRRGRFAAITNFRDPAQTGPAPRSRGELPLNFLLADIGPEQYLRELQGKAGEYAGFNLLLGEGDALWYMSNSGALDARGPRELPPGIYGLSNASLDTPWPKVELGKQVLAQSLLGTISHCALQAVVGDRNLAMREQLELQGLNGEMDELLSAQFIVNASYGTRATTSCWRDLAGRFHWQETSVDASGDVSGRVTEVIELR